jgi:CBS-domain-containing membrane protein
MTTDAVTVTEDVSLDEVVRLMVKRRIKRLPVVRGREVIGIVTRANLVHALAGLARDSNPHHPAIKRSAIGSWRSWRANRGHRCHSSTIVTDGVVELWGNITDERERQAIIVAAENAPDVKAVKDHWSGSD